LGGSQKTLSAGNRARARKSPALSMFHRTIFIL
jgi:hypothetical protein